MYKYHHAAGSATGCGPAFENRFYHRHPHFMGHRRPKYNVPLTVEEKEEYYEVHVFATGFSKENINIKVVDDLLYISGTKELEAEKSPNFSIQEFPVKNFERTLALNGKVAVEKISATQRDGVLVITLPKSEEAKSKETSIDVK